MKNRLKFNFWGIITAISCLVIPIATMGGIVPSIIGLLGAIICFKFVGDTRIPPAHRLAIAIAMLSICWGMVGIIYLIS